MGAFNKIEKRLESVVNGVFARAFKGDVQPVEIAARLTKELDSEAKLLSRDRRLVPNEFVIGLSQGDYDQLMPYGKTLTGELIPELRSHASSQGYVFNGPIMIHYDLIEKLPTGKFTVSSEAVAGVESDDSPSTTSINRAQLVLEVNGMRHPLTPPGLTIGRGSEADLRISDPGISRKHAEITVVQRGEDLDVQIADLGSTNGIVVNGNRVRHAVLAEGSRIQIGGTRMLIHAPAGR